MLGALERYLIKYWLVNVTRTAGRGRGPRARVDMDSPDIEGVTSFLGQPVFGAVEECDTYAMKEARERLERLSDVRNAAVFLVVPAECLVPAKRYVQDKLEGRNITVLPYGSPELWERAGDR